MWVKIVVPLLCVFLLEEALAAAPPKITEEQKAIMRRGVEAGRKYVNILKNGNFQDALRNMDTFVKPWAEGMEMHMYFFWLFFRTTADDILDEVKKGFSEVNDRLDTVISEVREIKKLIQWKDMEVRFGEIEGNIRLLDTTLKEALRAPSREDGINRFKEIFSMQYNNAGFFLYDSVANNDQVFQKNLLSAGMKYSDNHRRQCHGFFKGLIGLLIKAMNAEIANEKFNNLRTGQKVIWRERLQRSRAAMDAADTAMETQAWKRQPGEDAKVIAKGMTKKSHQEFVNKMYSHLTTKFYWRYWLVIAYDKVDGLGKHYQYFAKNAYEFKSFRQYDRNFIILSADPKDKSFNNNLAKSYIRNVTCRNLPHRCHRNTAKWVIDLTRKYGKGKLVVRKGTKLAYKASRGRYAYGQIRLLRTTPGFYATYNMLYFG